MRPTLAAVAALALGLLAAPAFAPAFAQASFPTASPTWQANVAAQYATLLASDNDRVRADALGQIQQVARQRPDLDLRGTYGPLLALVESNASDALRMAAVAALHAIGDTPSMERLAVSARYERAPAVRHVIRAALRDHRASLPTNEVLYLSYRVR